MQETSEAKHQVLARAARKEGDAMTRNRLNAMEMLMTGIIVAALMFFFGGGGEWMCDQVAALVSP
jgi:hypothetical protein